MAEVVATIGASIIPVLLKPVMDKAMTAVVDLGFDIKREIEELHNTLEVIQGILPEAEEMQVVNIQIRHWLRKLVDIGYEARDVLDELVTISATTSGRYSSLPFHLLHRIVGSRGSSYVPVVLSRRLQRRLSNEVKNVRKRLDELEKQTKIVEQFKSMGGGSRSIPICSRPETGPFLNKQRDLFVGRRDVKEGIMEKLLNHNDSRVHIVPIWGMGGVGKTTLAQSIYNDGRVTEEEYPKKNRRWLCVGEKKFNAKEIISKITDKSGTNDVEVFQRKLIEKFKGDRFFVVLDDIWDIDSSEWKLLWDPLTNVGKGGLIIVTTRTRDVIAAINTPVPDYLRPLSYDDCWQIFESYAFINENSCSDLELKKSIGKQIVEKLKGLPLAAEVVGCSLSNEPHVRNWTNFLDAHEWKISTRDDDVMPALRWSYNRLPSHLKQCFAYCSLFPKDHIFDEETLVKMWMAHGFIENVEGGGETRRPEDIGVSYFKQLVYASLFQYVDDKYLMHDMIHDLAVLVSNEEFLRTDGLLLNVGQLGKKIRHIYIDQCYFWENLSLCKSKRSTLNRLLTMYTVHDRPLSYTPGIYFTPDLCKNVIRDTFKQFKSIRVLVLDSHEIAYIPKCISELIHLRYLDIEKTNISRIPDTLCDLHNLQTLIASVSNHFSQFSLVLPENIVNMVNLRHLRACLPTCKGVKNLTSLQELYSISVSKGDKISELGEMRQLRGHLTIKCLENVTSWEDAAQAMMQEKTYIDHLELEFMKGLGDSTDVQTKVLDALQCPPNLRRLEIDGYNGITSPSWMADGKLITNLQSLHLSDCHQLELLPPLGQLKCLEYLYFSELRAIKKLGEEFYGKQIKKKVFFPSLETLELKSMENLKEWDDIVIEDTSMMFFPYLKKLTIRKCPKLVSALPHVNIKDPSRNVANVMMSLSALYISFCDGLVVLELGILVSLKDLNIWNCYNLTRITSSINVGATIEKIYINEGCEKLEKMEFGSLSSLKNLRVSCCNELISFPRQVSIEELVVYECEKLRLLNISDPGLNSLQSLTVVKCPMLEILFEDASTSSSSSSSALPLSSLRLLETDNILFFSKLLEHDLVSLEELYIRNFPKVEISNEIVKNNWHKLTLLETLVICGCDDLESLPPDIHKLSSLKNLWLHGCPNLQALPVDGLPLSLEVLAITRCPLLYERCQMESGPDWDKIKHVPEREIPQTFTVSDFSKFAGRLRFRIPFVDSSSSLFQSDLRNWTSMNCPMLDSVFEEATTYSSSSSSSDVIAIVKPVDS